MKAENLNAIQEEQTQRYEARIPRYHEAVVKDEEKKVCYDSGKIVFTDGTS